MHEKRKRALYTVLGKSMIFPFLDEYFGLVMQNGNRINKSMLVVILCNSARGRSICNQSIIYRSTSEATTQKTNTKKNSFISCIHQQNYFNFTDKKAVFNENSPLILRQRRGNER